MEVWSPCSEPCGGGQQHRNLTCVQVISQGLTKAFPESECAHLTRPVSSQKCNNIDCMPGWIVGDWSEVRLLYLREKEDKVSEMVRQDWCIWLANERHKLDVKWAQNKIAEVCPRCYI